VAVTASAQLAVWEKIQTDNPDYGAHGPRAVELAMRMFQRETPQERAYRTYLTELPAPLVYPEREPSPTGSAILTNLAHPQLRQHRQQRLRTTSTPSAPTNTNAPHHPYGQPHAPPAPHPPGPLPHPQSTATKTEATEWGAERKPCCRVPALCGLATA